MIVYIESNFVLELAFLQEDYRSCQAIYGLAHNSKIQLVIPAFSIGEPYETWIRKSKARKNLHDSLMQEIRQMSRSKPYRHFSESSTQVTKSLIESIEEEKRRLDNSLQDILRFAEVIPIKEETLKRAIRYQALTCPQ